MEVFSELVSDFLEANRNYFLFSPQKGTKYCEKHQSLYKKYLFVFYDPRTNIHLVTLFLYNVETEAKQWNEIEADDSGI
jgi:hypothetical protein